MDIRLVLALAGAAFTLFVGAWVRAEWVLTERVQEMALGAPAVCASGRGTAGPPPTPEQIAGRFRALAADHGFDVGDVSVRMEPLRAGQGGVMGGVVAQLATMTGGAVKMEGVQVTVDAQVHGEEWLWSTDKPITATCTLQTKIERVMPERTFGE